MRLYCALVLDFLYNTTPWYDCQPFFQIFFKIIFSTILHYIVSCVRVRVRVRVRVLPGEHLCENFNNVQKLVSAQTTLVS